jgi:hypothetical protein
VEASSIDSHHDPCVWKKEIALLESLHVLIPMKMSESRLDVDVLGLLTLNSPLCVICAYTS